MSKTAHQALRDARALIASEEMWTQHAFARNEMGLEVYTRSPDAVCFCALGALNRVLDREDETGSHPAFRLLTIAAESIEPEASPAWINDERGHKAVLKMYDHALEAAQP